MLGRIEKLKILVVIDEMPAELWKQFQSRAEITFVRDGLNAYRHLCEERYDLTLLDLYLTGMDSFELLRRIRAERLCRMVVLTSEAPSFFYAQQGILYGVSAYLLRPLKKDELQEVFHRLQNDAVPNYPAVEQAAKRILSQLRSHSLNDLLDYESQRIQRSLEQLIQQSLQWRALYEELLQQVFRQYPWLKLYHHPEEFSSLDSVWDTDSHVVQTFCVQKIKKLSECLHKYLPDGADERTEEMLVYLLQTIDQNLQQVDVAGHFYITGSTMSTRFQRQMGITYREYVTRLKISRAQYLLRYSDISAKEIAAYLGYKDRAYFAKIFLQCTGKTLQEYGQKPIDSFYCI